MSKLFKSKKIINQLYSKIEIYHNSPNRYYHNISHLLDLDTKRQELKLSPKDDIIFQFATYYHDIIYDINKTNNEKKSAIFAKNSLYKLRVPHQIIDEVYQIIILTKTHPKTDNLSFAYFLDADISILGSSWEDYQRYMNQIRQEYQIYSDTIYSTNRNKILESFLNKNQIYQTSYFRDKYEKQARENIKMEIFLNSIN